MIEGWSRRDHTLHYKNYSDVGIRWDDSNLDGEGFLAMVGNLRQTFPTLQDAIDWCEDVTHGREILLAEGDMIDNPAQRIAETRGLKI